MLASLHIARHSAANAARVVARARRWHPALPQVRGLSAGHLFATIDLTTSIGGLPTPARWALFCAWEDEEALDSFENSAVFEAFADRSREIWQARLQTVRVVEGEWRGWRPSIEGVEPLRPDEPLAVMTYGLVRPRYMPTFLVNNRRAVRQVDRQPGLLARIGLADKANAASTFSLWRSQGDAVRFAYGDGVHAPIVRRSKTPPWGSEYFFARFRILSADGSWDGRDPLGAQATVG